MATPPRPSASLSDSHEDYRTTAPARRTPDGHTSPRLWRSRSNRMIAGVLGGLAERFGLETTPLRILVALFALGSGGLLAIVYIVLWAVAGEHEVAERASSPSFRRSRDAVLAGVLGGVARKLGFDTTLVRILYVVVSLISAAFPGILVYLILWTLSGPADARDADVR